MESSDCDGVAGGKVFSTTELLEAILVEVSMDTLLTSQPVNKQWKATISGTKQIQQNLFFTATEAEGAFRLCSHEEEDNETSYALEVVPFKDVVPEAWFPFEASLNPLFELGADEDDDSFDRACSGDVVVIDDEVLLVHVCGGDKESFDPRLHLDVHASYLDMFLCQPPAEAVMLRCAGYMEKVENEQGLRISDIVNSCAEMIAAAREGSNSNSAPIGSIVGRLDIKFPGQFFYHDLSPALLFSSPDDEEMEELRLKDGLTYRVWDATPKAELQEG